MFLKFVNILRIAQKVLVVALGIVVGVMQAINTHMSSGEASATA